jgi:hypothetical protein
VFAAAAALAAGPVALRAKNAEVLDRVVGSVDYRAITASDVEAEYRFEGFVNGEMPSAPPDAGARNRIRDRLVEQALLSGELDNGEGETASGEEGSKEWEEIQKKFSSPEAFQAALKALGLDKQQVLERLRTRDAILQLIDRRLRPEASPEPSDIETYYKKTFVPAYLKHNQGPAPALPDVQDRIREILTQQKINKLLDAWLEDLKASHRVELHEY